MSFIPLDENRIDEIRRLLQDDPKTWQAEEDVCKEFGDMFSLDNLGFITKGDFKRFLKFENNHHWKSLERLNHVTDNLPELISFLRILLDDNRSIENRLEELFPANGQHSTISGLHRAIVTPVLLVTHPKEYGVWNGRSEKALALFGLMPEFASSDGFSSRYLRVNQVLKSLAARHTISLWQLDAIFGWVGDKDFKRLQMLQSA